MKHLCPWNLPAFECVPCEVLCDLPDEIHGDAEFGTLYFANVNHKGDANGGSNDVR